MSDRTFEMAGKLAFDHLYEGDRPDLYYQGFALYSYRSPDSVMPLLAAHIKALQHRSTTPDITIVDVGCSFGITAMLYRCNRTFSKMTTRFKDVKRIGAHLDTIVAVDREYIAKHPIVSGVSFVGVDRAKAALEYTKRVGLHSWNICIDLEKEHPQDISSNHPMIVVATGAIGYVSPSGLLALLNSLHSPMICGILIVSRTLNVAQLDQVLQTNGYMTRSLPHCLKQRRFGSLSEQVSAIKAVQGFGKDSTGLEDTGWVFGCPIIFGKGDDYPALKSKLEEDGHLG